MTKYCAASVLLLFKHYIRTIYHSSNEKRFGKCEPKTLRYKYILVILYDKTILENSKYKLIRTMPREMRFDLKMSKTRMHLSTEHEYERS